MSANFPTDILYVKNKCCYDSLPKFINTLAQFYMSYLEVFQNVSKSAHLWLSNEPSNKLNDQNCDRKSIVFLPHLLLFI